MKIEIEKASLYLLTFLGISTIWFLHEISFGEIESTLLLNPPVSWASSKFKVQSDLLNSGTILKQYGLKLNSIITNRNSTNKKLLLLQKSFSKNYTKCLHQQLRHVLIAINFNFPHYSNIRTLKNFYKPIFGKVVFCGDVKNKNHEILQLKENRGYQGYECLSKAIRRYRNFTGYIYSNDDVIVNWWNLGKYDLKKIWTGTPISFDVGHIFGEQPPPQWHWWNKENTATLCEQAFEDVERFQSTPVGKELFLDIFVARYYKNTKNKKICLADWSDLFYIPNEFSKIFVELSEIFYRRRVYLEVAVPMILTFLVNSSNHAIMDGVNLQDYYGDMKTFYSGKAFYDMYSHTLDFIHPFKFNGHEQNVNKIFFKTFILSFGNKIDESCHSKIFTS